MTIITAGLIVLSLFSQMPEFASVKPGVQTTWRFYHQPLGLNAYFPVKFEAQSLTFGLNYRGFGLKVAGFDLHAWDLFKDFDENHKFVGMFAPVYVGWLPKASHRPKGDILPTVLEIYVGACLWGIKGGRMFDAGISFQHYLLQLNAGFKSLRAKSRNCFVDDPEFDDYEVSAGNIYLSLRITPGMWIALKSNTRSP